MTFFALTLSRLSAAARVSAMEAKPSSLQQVWLLSGWHRRLPSRLQPHILKDPLLFDLSTLSGSRLAHLVSQALCLLNKGIQGPTAAQLTSQSWGFYASPGVQLLLLPQQPAQGPCQRQVLPLPSCCLPSWHWAQGQGRSRQQSNQMAAACCSAWSPWQAAWRQQVPPHSLQAAVCRHHRLAGPWAAQRQAVRAAAAPASQPPPCGACA